MYLFSELANCFKWLTQGVLDPESPGNSCVNPPINPNLSPLKTFSVTYFTLFLGCISFYLFAADGMIRLKAAVQMWRNTIDLHYEVTAALFSIIIFVGFIFMTFFNSWHIQRRPSLISLQQFTLVMGKVNFSSSLSSSTTTPPLGLAIPLTLLLFLSSLNPN